MEEEWKPIKNYEGLYEVSNTGEVRSICSRWGKREKSREVSIQTNPSGYKRVRLSKNNKRSFFMVHRLVYEAFIGDIPSGFEINHKDLNRGNNCLENLEIMTHLENVQYSHATKVKQYTKENKLVRIWNSIREVERELKIDRRQIWDNLKGKQKTCHGFIFREEG